MNARSLNSARSGGVNVFVVGLTIFIAFWLAFLGMADVVQAKPPKYKIEFVGQYGDRLKALPSDIIIGNETELVDRRMHKDIVRLSRKFKQIATDCYSPLGSGEHSDLGDHPKGVGCDFAPNTRIGGTWKDTYDFAVYMGWQASCAKLGNNSQIDPNGKHGCGDRLSRLSVPSRWIGHNGTICHGDPQHVWGGCGAHLHISFKSSPTPRGGWPKRVMRFAEPNGKKNDVEPPEIVIEPIDPSVGAGVDPEQYPVEFSGGSSIANLPSADETEHDNSVPSEHGGIANLPSSDEAAAAYPETQNLGPGISTSAAARSSQSAKPDLVDVNELGAMVEVINRNIDSSQNNPSTIANLPESDKIDLASLAFEAADAKIKADKPEKGPDPDGVTPTAIANLPESDAPVMPEDEGVPYVPPVIDIPNAKVKAKAKKRWFKNGRYVLHGKDKAEMVFNYFNEHPRLKLTSFQAAALVGNISVESAGSFNPNINQFGGGPGRGIVQWTVNARWQVLLNWAKDHGRKPLKLHTQLDFVAHELMGSYNFALRALRRTNKLADATYVVERQYEAPAHGSTGIRINRAREAFRNHLRGRR